MLKLFSKKTSNAIFNNLVYNGEYKANEEIVNRIFYIVRFGNFQFSKCVCDRETSFSLRGKCLLFSFFTKHTDRFYGKLKYNDKNNFAVLSRNRKPKLSGNDNDGIMFYNVEKSHFQLKRRFKTGEVVANILVSYGRKNDVTFVVNIGSGESSLYATVNTEQFKSNGSIPFIDNKSFPWIILCKPLTNTIVLQRPDFCEDIVAMALMICCFIVFG